MKIAEWNLESYEMKHQNPGTIETMCLGKDAMVVNQKHEQKQLH